MRRPVACLIAILIPLLWSPPLVTAEQASGNPAPATGARPSTSRPRIGVAFGGGSARGLAHVGVLRWFEEHHIPIDLVAGTSMGGLVGGAFSAGMSSTELSQLLATTDWDAMFGSSLYQYKNIRRKQDARSYPSRIEFGVKRGIVPPLALNTGQQVDFLIGRIAGTYLSLQTFDSLPTPFRCVAVDLVTAQPVVLDRGHLADAMRATMSLPGIFPPIELDGRVLVDGGAMNNVPADVVRAMGADTVIAVNVGDMSEKRAVNYSLLGLMGQTVDAMMLANTRVAMRAADIIINPSLTEFGSLDWRRNTELAEAGYRAAESMKNTLLPLAIDEEAWKAYLAARNSRRQATLATPKFVSIVGAVTADRRRMEEVLAPLVDQPIDLSALETELETLGGLDRYETVGWQLVEENGQTGLRVRARPKSSAPPFLMLGLSLENTTTDEFSFQLSARYLTFDVVGSGSELRLDAAVGALPHVAAAIHRPIGKTHLFVSASGLVGRQTLNFVRDDAIIAQYNETRARIGVGGGADIGRIDQVRFDVLFGRLDATVHTGDPELPELGGPEVRGELQWLHDGTDSPVVPSRGMRNLASMSYMFVAPEVPPTFMTDRSNQDLLQAQIRSGKFWTYRRRDRLFVVGGAGTSFDGHPLPTDQFQLGRPFYLSAYDVGELRGNHYGSLTGGYLRGVGRMPDFIGGPVFIGAWVEGGSAFDDIDEAKFRSSFSVGAILDSLIGPMTFGGSVSADGHWRYYIGIGRLF